jgi:hypothetical protein
VLLSISMQMWRNRLSSRNRFEKLGAESAQKYRGDAGLSALALFCFFCVHNAGGDKETTIVTHSPPSSPHLVVTLPPPPPHACMHAFEQQSHFSTPNRGYAVAASLARHTMGIFTISRRRPICAMMYVRFV